MTKDHITPKAKGGKDHISNMQTMCSTCNWEKKDGEKFFKSEEEFLDNRSDEKFSEIIIESMKFWKGIDLPLSDVLPTALSGNNDTE